MRLGELTIQVLLAMKTVGVTDSEHCNLVNATVGRAVRETVKTRVMMQRRQNADNDEGAGISEECKWGRHWALGTELCSVCSSAVLGVVGLRRKLASQSEREAGEALGFSLSQQRRPIQLRRETNSRANTTP